MAVFNPNTPSTIGVEWDVATESVTPLTTPTTCAAWLCASTATETISTIYVPHSWTGASSGYGKLVVDVYDLADTGAGSTPATTRYQPNETKTNNNMFAPYPWSSITTTAHTVVDETAYSDSDYLAFTWTSYAKLAFNTTAFTGQVVSVSWEIRAFGYYGTTGNLSVELYNGTSYVSRLGTIAPPANGDDTHLNFVTYTIGPFTTNPLTGVAWTQTDISNMDTGTNLMVMLSCNTGNVAVSWVSMIVSSGTDKRKATGSTATQTSLPSGFQTNLPVTLAANWSKVSGTNYLLVARRLDDPTGLASTLIPQPVYIADAATPWTGASYSTTLDSSGLLATTGSVDTSKTYPFWLGRSDVAMSVDSQPYWNLTAKPCHTSSTLKQGVLGTANTYKGVRAMITYAAGAVPTADLLIKVKRTSDNVQLGGTATVTTTIADAADFYGTIVDTTYGTLDFVSVAVDLASTASLAAVAYYFEFTSSTGSGTPWFVLMLDGTASHALTGNTTYGGSTYQADIAGAGTAAGDFIARISTSPAAPSSITVTNTTTTINGTSIDYADVDWVSGGALGAAFEWWEVDRSEDAGTTWTNIATISTEATLTFADYEGLRSNANKYRVRAVRTDGAHSDWTTQSGTVTPAAMVGAKAVFTTNAAPTLTVGYVPHGTDATYRFLSADETVYVRLHDRDYQAAFKPLEQRGMSWSFQVQVYIGTGTPTGGAGTGAYTALRAIADNSDAPYLCLHTGDGQRFFGSIQAPQGDRDLAVGAYLATVTFTETQADSSAVAS